MKVKVFFLFFIGLALFITCSGDKRYDKLMMQADSIMELGDDSAMTAIRMLNGIKPQIENLTKSQKMRYELLYYKASNKADITFTSDSVMKEIVAYYDHYGTANEKMLANYILGCVYRDMREAPLALEYYHKAIELADTTAVDCNYGTLCRIYSQMGFLFDKQYLPYQVLEAFSKAEKYAYLAKDTLNAIINYQHRGNAYEYLGKIDSVIAINLHAAKMFKQIGDNYDSSIAYGCNYRFYLEKGDLEKAQKAYGVYSAIKYDGNTNYEDSKAFILYEKGLYYLNMLQFDSAYCYLDKSLRLCKSYSNKSATTKALAQYYLKNNQPMLAAKYSLLSSEYCDSDFIDARKTQLQQIQAMYDYGRNQEHARKAEKEVKQRNQYILGTIMFCCSIFLLGTLLYRRQMLLKKKKITVTQNLYEDCLLKQRTMQAELKKLVATNEQKTTAIILEKENAIKKLKEEMEKIQKQYSYPLSSNIDIMLKNSSIYKRMKYLEMHPREKMRTEDWSDLEKTVEDLIPSFIPILKNRLKDADFRICLLVRFGLPTSTIASLMELSVPAISKYRKVMLEKLCGKQGKPKEFDEYICQIV